MTRFWKERQINNTVSILRTLHPKARWRLVKCKFQQEPFSLESLVDNFKSYRQRPSSNVYLKNTMQGSTGHIPRKNGQKNALSSSTSYVQNP